MKKIETFLTPGLTKIQTIFCEIENNYTLAKDAPVKKIQHLYDTFDWRLFRNNLTFIKEKNLCFLDQFNSETDITPVSCKYDKQPRFWWDFPEGLLKVKLQSYLGVRVLLSQAIIKKTTQVARILNEDEKIVVRLLSQDISLAENNQQLVSLIKLSPVTGYYKELNHFKNFLKNLGLTGEPGTVLKIIFEASGQKPGSYSSRLKIKLNPALTAQESTKIIMLSLLATIKKNEDGIKSDLDTEFLHDFRVAIRRTRSGLTQIKSVFPEQVVSRFRRDFTHLAKLTNKMRDLDVYLLKQDLYRSMLPKNLNPFLDPLFFSISKQRKTEFKKLLKCLDSNFYKRTVTEWQEFLSVDIKYPPEQTKNRTIPVTDLAGKYIYKQYKRVINYGRTIENSTPDEKLHRLRIECKKLRYLLEFFNSLFPRDEMASLIKQFKKLQDNLGDFNDLSIQQNTLKNYLNGINSTGKNVSKNSAAIGGLMSILFQEQQLIRESFSRIFTGFNCDSTHRLFKRLFE